MIKPFMAMPLCKTPNGAVMVTRGQAHSEGGSQRSGGGREEFVVDVLCCRSIWDGRKIIWEDLFT